MLKNQKHDLGLGWFAKINGEGSMLIANEELNKSIVLTPKSVETLRKILRG